MYVCAKSSLELTYGPFEGGGLEDDLKMTFICFHFQSGLMLVPWNVHRDPDIADRHPGERNGQVSQGNETEGTVLLARVGFWKIAIFVAKVHEIGTLPIFFGTWIATNWHCRYHRSFGLKAYGVYSFLQSTSAKPD